MSTWDSHGVAETAWPTFDEMVWNEFEETGDHTVPESEGSVKAPWGSKLSSASEIPGIPGRVLVQTAQNPPYTGCSFPNPSNQEIDASQNRQSGCSSGSERKPLPPGKGSCGNSSTAYSSMSNVRTTNMPSTVNPQRLSEGEREFGKVSNFDPTDYDFEGADGLCKIESGYQDDGTDILNGSCQFLLNDICPPGGDLEFLEEVQDEGKGNNLLEYGWENCTNNLEDMGKLFLNNGPVFPQSFNDASEEMLWESSSPAVGNSPGIMYQSFRECTEHDLEHEESELKMELPPCGTSEASLNMEVEEGTLGHTLPWHGECSAAVNIVSFPFCGPADKQVFRTANTMEKPRDDQSLEVLEGSSMPSGSLEEDKKVNKVRRHGVRTKKLDEKPRKQSTVRKPYSTSHNSAQIKKPQLPYVPISSAMQDFPALSIPISQITQHPMPDSPSNMHCPRPVPFVHAGFGFPAHRMPIVIPSTSVAPVQLQHAQPVMIGHQPVLSESSKHHQVGNMNQIPAEPPRGSSTMTPKEKIEKLRWRQKMQAQLAVQQQQHQLINEHLLLEKKQFQRKPQSQPRATINCPEEAAGERLLSSQVPEPVVWKEGLDLKTDVATEDGDESLPATVLQQLLDIATQLDPRTRLCLRDGFQRLARSARQRRSTNDGGSNIRRSAEVYKGSIGLDSSSSSELSSSGRFLTVAEIVETETNPIDRFIAQLLFHKQFSPSFGNFTSIIDAHDENLQLQRRPSTWQAALPSPEVSPATGPLNVKGSSFPSHDVPTCSNNGERFSGTSACQSSSNASDLGLEGDSPLQVKALPSRHLEDNIESKEGFASYGNTDSRTRSGSSACNGVVSDPDPEGQVYQDNLSEKGVQSPLDGGLYHESILDLPEKRMLSTSSLNSRDDPEELVNIQAASMQSLASKEASECSLQDKHVAPSPPMSINFIGFNEFGETPTMELKEP